MMLDIFPTPDTWVEVVVSSLLEVELLACILWCIAAVFITLDHRD